MLDFYLKLLDLLSDIEHQYSFLDDQLAKAWNYDACLTDQAWRFYIKYHKYVN